MTSVAASGQVLEVNDLAKHFPLSNGLIASRDVARAVDGVTLAIAPGETLGLVGESGSGKSTVGKCILRLLRPTSGHVILEGTDITDLPERKLRPLRRMMHIVFQDPYASLDPRMTVGDIVAGPLRHHGVATGRAADERVDQMLALVKLQPEIRGRFPHQLSGGMRQRVAIARALVLRPRLLVADEPLSALDASVQAAILNLLVELQHELGFSCLFITHDLSAAEFFCDRIAVMYLGRLVETASREQLFNRPKHPYTQALLSAVPLPDPRAQRARRRVILEGEIPSPTDIPSGCVFHPRCPLVFDECRSVEPRLVDADRDGHLARCHLVGPGTVPNVLARASTRDSH
jgi:oligopeptide/dipeptide ABC transporter ATP-binding protein